MRISDWSSDVCSSDLAHGQVPPAAPVEIGHDRLAADLVEGDVLRRVAGRGGDGHRGEDLVRILRRPLEHLHAAHRPAGHARSEERRVGEECVRTCWSRWVAYK